MSIGGGGGSHGPFQQPQYVVQTKCHFSQRRVSSLVEMKWNGMMILFNLLSDNFNQAALGLNLGKFIAYDNFQYNNEVYYFEY